MNPVSPRLRSRRSASRPRLPGRLLVVGLVIVGAAIAGCGPGSATSAGSRTGAPAGEGGAPAPGGEGAPAGGEAPPTLFTHPTLHYSIEAPGPMVAVAGGGASYTGTSDYLHISTVTGSGDPMALAQADATGRGVPGFVLVQSPRPTTINGLSGALLEFTKSAGTNPVTGRTQLAHVLRVYLPRTGGAYRLEYGATVPAQDWDPQGALDNLSTFRAAP